MPRLDLPPFKHVNGRDDLAPEDTDFFPDGSGLLLTPPMRLLLAGAPRRLSSRHLVLVDGESGCGKSTGLAALAAASPVPVARSVITSGKSRTRVLEAIYASVTGTRPGYSDREYENRLWVMLAEQPRLLFVNEAQNAGLDVLQTLRLMMEAPGAQFAMVLAGTGIRAKVQREDMLRTWIGLTVNFNPLDPATDLIPTLTAWHPALAETNPRLLREADRNHCHGRLREWAFLLETLLDYAPDGRFTRAVISDAIESITGTTPTLVA